jgi:hypothetical protein
MKSGPASKPTAREAEPFSGHRKVQEANATSRKVRGSHNPVDRASGPRRKAADVDLVSHPETAVKVANRGES